MSNIYEITDRFLQVQELIESGEYDKEMLETTLECIDCELEEKADGYARIIRNMEVTIAGLKAEEERLGQRRKAMENGVKGLKENLLFAMQTTGKVKFKTELFSFNVQKNPAKLVLVEGAEIPAEYLIEQEPKVDTAGIKEQLKMGEVFDFAKLEQTEGVRIR